MNNEHPLTDDLSKLSHEDLEKRLTELNKRWYAAKRMGMAQQVLNQLDMLLQGLEYEKQRRNQQLDHQSGVVIDSDGTDGQAS